MWLETVGEIGEAKKEYRKQTENLEWEFDGSDKIVIEYEEKLKYYERIGSEAEGGIYGRRRYGETKKK